MTYSNKKTSMELLIKETDHVDYTPQRKKWTSDPDITNYIFFRENTDYQKDSEALTDFQRFYEVYNRDKLVGDIKIFYETENDIVQKRGQILMIVGDRNNGIGTRALGMLLEKLKNSYNMVYCYILKSNIASLKMLKKNGFLIENIDGDELTLSRHLN